MSWDQDTFFDKPSGVIDSRDWGTFDNSRVSVPSNEPFVPRIQMTGASTPAVRNEDGMRIIDVEQGTPGWLQARSGSISASRVAALVDPRSSRFAARDHTKVFNELVNERLTGQFRESIDNVDTRRGHDLEPLARQAYEKAKGTTVDQVGYVLHPSIEGAGASPDGLVGSDGLLEIKAPRAKTHLKYLRSGELPRQYQAQAMWQMAVTGREWVDFVSYNPELPEQYRLYVAPRFYADPERLAALQKKVRRVNRQIDQAVAAKLALGKRRDRQTQITGLRDEGSAQKNRHRLTSFGSGWRGIDTQLETEQAYNPWLRGAGVLAAGGAAYAGHIHMLRTNADYIGKLHKWATTFEDKSPFQWGRTLGLSERLAGRMPQELTFTREMLIQNGQLAGAGVTLQRQFEDRFNIQKFFAEGGKDLNFDRVDRGRLHMQLREAPSIETMFAPKGRRMAAVAETYGAELNEHALEWSTAKDRWTQVKENWEKIGESQRIHATPTSTVGAIAKELPGAEFLPYHTKFIEDFSEDIAGPFKWASQHLHNAGTRAGVEMLDLTQRPQVMFAQMRLGLEQGSYNKWAHIPFKGSGGYVNNILLKRVLPIVAGITALRYLDYETGHVASNALIDAPLKLNTMRADFADTLPGARPITDWYEDTVPGSQYGPMALPLTGLFAGGVYHYSRVVRGDFDKLEAKLVGTKGAKTAQVLREEASRVLPKLETLKKVHNAEGVKALWKELGHPGKGALIGLAAMLPFVPGMLFPRQTGQELRDIYSGVEPVPVRSGRFWELGSSALEGGRIKEWRPHKSVLMKAHAYEKSLWGSEAEAWKHNPIIHPLRWLQDPYALERINYEDRPYPVTSPAFTNVPLIGPLLAATAGRLVKPSRSMHSEEWDGQNYTLYSTRLEPKGPEALPPPEPKDEYSLSHVIGQEANIFAEFTGLPGFLAKSTVGAIFPDYGSPDVYWQGSRQIDNFSRYYYDMELGAGLGPAPNKLTEHFGYTEPFRRFVQRENATPQANEIRNTMPGWLPSNDYFVDLHVGDPYAKIAEGYARLPGAGYAALHPEVQDVPFDQYPDIHKLAILGDVAPYSREYNTYRQKVGAQAANDPELDIEYQKIVDRVRQTKDSVVRTDERHFTAPVEEVEGTVASVGMNSFQVREYPGRNFQFSSIGTSAADMSAAILRENNDLTRADVAREITDRRGRMMDFLSSTMGVGSSVKLTVAQGSLDANERVRAVVESDGINVNRELIEQGFASPRSDYGGAESQAMHGTVANALGSAAEGLSFTGADTSALNPMRLLPSPANTKLWQQRTALSQYINQEVSGTRLRRWERPIHDFLSPYARGAGQRVLGQTIVAPDTQVRRDLNSLTDTLNYMRGLRNQAKGSYTNQIQRTSIGANLFASPVFVASTLPDNEAHYFKQFLNEPDAANRAKILEVASPELQRALSAQWTAQQARIAEAEGQSVGEIGEGGRLYTKAGLEEYKTASTKLGYGDWLRTKEISDFFSRTGFAMPTGESPAFDDALDYQDVKLKIIQQEGYDSHDFDIFDDRTAMLWRKPYVDGAVRELTSGNQRSADQLRLQVEQLMLAAKNRNANVVTSSHASHQASSTTRIDVDIDETDSLLKDVRRNPEKYQNQ